MFNNISIVLVEPKGDENVGMTARAMKNCGVEDLRLVNPKPFKTKAALKWACSAKDILEKACVFSTLNEALYDASLAVGFSRRAGKLRPLTLEFEKSALRILTRAKKNKAALIFGREDDGLTKAELSECDFVTAIPTAKRYPSLNLAQTVLLVCHELLRRTAKKDNSAGNENKFITRSEMMPVFDSLSHALLSLDYDDKDGGLLRRKIIKSFKELFGRSGLRRKDANMFLGLTARIEEKIKGL